MQEEVSLELEPETVGKPIQPASTITRERLETAVTKIEDLANQFQDDYDLYWRACKNLRIRLAAN
jgi:hypothetical protein